VICDVFAERPLEGNPLCVFTDARGLDSAQMQALARELNLSETTFVTPPEQGGHARVRIFTPQRELPFAGHPTLGTAFVLGGPLQAQEVRLELAAGIVPVQIEREGARVSFGWMLQPPARVVPGPTPELLLAALGLDPTLPLESYGHVPAHGSTAGLRHTCVRVATVELLRGLRPDFPALARATDGGAGVFHWDGDVCRVRYFAPGAGVPEDPATGSFAGVLALHLFQREQLAAGTLLRIEQGAELRRPSTLYARVEEGAEPRASVGGPARIVARGQFLI
ncbi:MAG TPA: PhzF family phenazine biosynthesis protein, partial [Polyangiaceae bacterium]|nr:PhzF family phenazine biosynthesis protein [Polyangiaceae bacterium]